MWISTMGFLVGLGKAAGGGEHGVDAGLDGAEVAGGVALPKGAHLVEVRVVEIVGAAGGVRVVGEFATAGTDL